MGCTYGYVAMAITLWFHIQFISSTETALGFKTIIWLQNPNEHKKLGPYDYFCGDIIDDFRVQLWIFSDFWWGTLLP